MNTQEQAVMQQALDSLRDEPFLDLTTKQRAAMEAMCQALAAPALPLAASVTDDEIDAALRVATTCGDIIGTKEMRRALTAFSASRAAGAETAAPKGWKLVPVEPTPSMLNAMACTPHDNTPTGGGGHSFRVNMSRKEYPAMLDAAPKPPQGDRP